jgi:lipoprotein-anchoring transpeptidase ErfK/SrfK
VRRGHWVLAGITAALAAAIVAAALVDDRGDESRPEQQAKAKPAKRAAAPTQAKTGARTAAKAHKPRPAPSRSPARPRPAVLPHATARKLPWSGHGISEVARAVNRRLAVYDRPGARRPAVLLQNPDRLGIPRVLLVASQRRSWIRLYLPTRPDGRTGWVRSRAVLVLRNPYRIVVHLRRHRLVLFRGSRRVLATRIVSGAPATPTPRGLFYVTQLLRPPDPNGAYGPFSFGLSAHSRVLKEFAGGNGQVGIHGTNQPWLIGRSLSHGCIRVANGPIRRLARVLPLGTPVWIRA